MSRRQPAPLSGTASSTPATTSLASIHSLSSFLSYCSYRRGFLVRAVLFFLLLRLAVYVEFTAVYLCLAALYFIFLNTSHSQPVGNGPHVSAYSAFNTGGQRMAGSISLDSWEGAYRAPGTAAGADLGGVQRAAAPLAGVKPHPKRTSKAANQPCVCGSGKKYKNCCTPARESERALEQERDWQED